MIRSLLLSSFPGKMLSCQPNPLVRVLLSFNRDQSRSSEVGSETFRSSIRCSTCPCKALQDCQEKGERQKGWEREGTRLWDASHRRQVLYSGPQLQAGGARCWFHLPWLKKPMGAISRSAAIDMVQVVSLVLPCMADFYCF